MKKILCVGFGGMGIRHVQSFLGAKEISTIYVYETNPTIIENNLQRIGAENSPIVFLYSIEDIIDDIDFAVIATSAKPRYEITKLLLNKGIKNILLEKVVFQSKNQFDEIIELLEKNNAIAVCNFVNRYFEHYIQLKKSLKGENPIKMIVHGGDFGLGCNALHYIDLFEYLTDEKSILSFSDLKENLKGNKRGNEYKEVLGVISFKTKNNSSLTIISDEMNCNDVVITLSNNNITHIFNENTLSHYSCDSNGVVQKSKITLKFTSTLTKVIYDEMQKGIYLLPTVLDTQNSHSQLFKAINNCFKIEEDDLCPIT